MTGFEHTTAPQQRRICSDTILVIVGNVAMYLLFAYLDTFEFLTETLGQYEDYELDEFVPSLTLIALSFLWLAQRRLKEARKLKDHFQYLATHDHLTGLYNRTTLTEQTQAYINRHKSNQGPYALIITELSDLRTINEKYGHKAGDHALKAIATVLQDQNQRTSRSARWSGKQFITVCNKTSKSQAQAQADGILEQIAENDILKAFSPKLHSSIASSDEELSFDRGIDLALMRLSAKKRAEKHKGVHSPSHNQYPQEADTETSNDT